MRLALLCSQLLGEARIPLLTTSKAVFRLPRGHSCNLTWSPPSFQSYVGPASCQFPMRLQEAEEPQGQGL